MKKFFRRLDIGYLISDSFRNNKWCYIGMLCCAALGLIMGIGFAANGSVTFINVSVTRYYAITTNISIAGVFVRRLFSTLVCFALVFVFSLHAAMCPAHFLLIMLRGYYFGALSVLLVYQYSFSGVICVIFALIPSQLILLALLVVAATYGMSCSIRNRRYGSILDFKNFSLFFVVCYLINLVGVLVECLLIALIVNPLFL